jgi:hypothetical protein
MRRIHCLTMSLALALTGMLSVAALSPVQAQTVRSYCLTGGGGELGRCGYPTFEACRLDGAGFGTCIASERPAWGDAAGSEATVPTGAKRRR